MQRWRWMLGVLLLRSLRLRRLHWLLALQAGLLLWWTLGVPIETHRRDADVWHAQAWLQSLGILFWLDVLMASWRSPAQLRAEAVISQSPLGQLQSGLSLWAYMVSLASMFWLLLLGGAGSWLFAELRHPHFEMSSGQLLSWFGQMAFWCLAFCAVESSRLSVSWRRLTLMLLGFGLFLFYPANRVESLGAWVAAASLLVLLQLFFHRGSGMFHVEPVELHSSLVPRGTSPSEDHEGQG